MPRLPSERMAQASIVQKGQPVLRKRPERFTLPADQAEVEHVIGQLHSAVERVKLLYNFSKGMGIAAPQIDIDRVAAVVFPRPGGKAVHRPHGRGRRVHSGYRVSRNGPSMGVPT